MKKELSRKEKRIIVSYSSYPGVEEMLRKICMRYGIGRSSGLRRCIITVYRLMQQSDKKKREETVNE